MTRAFKEFIEKKIDESYVSAYDPQEQLQTPHAYKARFGPGYLP